MVTEVDVRVLKSPSRNPEFFRNARQVLQKDEQAFRGMQEQVLQRALEKALPLPVYAPDRNALGRISDIASLMSSG
ncbi:hypothetical protein J4475_00390, partial [Candidatus Woesearchaeota archaeon]|nr:hypothetical protein [Candidatus Woesearchaeota archaeon]